MRPSIFLLKLRWTTLGLAMLPAGCVFVTDEHLQKRQSWGDSAQHTGLAIPDLDGDGYGDAEVGGDDCDDGDPAVFPDAPEVCDGLDQDCDVLIDEELVTEIWYSDADGDGFGDPATAVEECAQPVATSSDSTDCDDSDAGSFPGADEIWYDGLDEDCAGGDDYDADGDGHASDGDDSDYDHESDLAMGLDCDDTRADIHPESTEEGCDLVDQDCDGGDVGYRQAVAADGSSWYASFTSIQDAIGAASDGDEICIAPGTYEERIDFLEKAISIVGAGGSAVTTLDGSGTGPVVTLNSASAPGSLVGLTVTGGLGVTNGGGVLIDWTAGAPSPLYSLTDLVVADNEATYGGGIYISGAVVVASELVIRHNVALRGGGVFATGGATLLVENSSILENEGSYGGGTEFASDSEATFEGVRFWNNEASYGGAVHVSGGSITAHHVDMRNNEASIGGAIWATDSTLDFSNAVFACNRASDENAGAAYLYEVEATVINAVFVANSSIVDGGAIASFYDSLTLSNTSIYGNTAGAESTAVDTFAGTFALSSSHAEANDPADFNDTSYSPGPTTYITGEPRFADYDPATDCTTWDLTLGSLSPLQDAGDPAVLDADGSTSDIGAYGGPGGASWPSTWPE